MTYPTPLGTGTVLAPSPTLAATLTGEPAPTPSTAPMWAAAATGRLRLQWCDACRRFLFPPRRLCPSCWSQPSWMDAAGHGTLSSYVVVRRAVDALPRPLPYVVGVVRLAESVDVMATVVGLDVSAIRVGLTGSIRFAAMQHGGRLLCFHPDSGRA